MKSFLHAFRGICHAVKTERNFRIHLAAVYYVVIFGIESFFYITDWALIALACGLVIGAELINTALERLCDGLEPGRSPVVKTVKDLAAGAVLVCAAAAAGIAVFVFWWPVSYFIKYWDFSDFLYHFQYVLFLAIAALPFWVWFIFLFGVKKER
jgi:diacylglycerol kinase